MAQGRLERIRLRLVREVISAGAKESRAQDRTRHDLPLQVEIILHRVRELRMIRRRENIYRLCHDSILRVEKAGKHKRIYAEKRRQEPIDAKQQYRELIAKDAASAPQHGPSFAENVPCKSNLGGQKIHWRPGKHLADGWSRIHRWITDGRKTAVHLGRIRVEVVA